MTVLFISNDPLLLDETSHVRARMQAYATAIGVLHIMTRAGEEVVQKDGPLTIHGVVASKGTGWKNLIQYAHELIQKEKIEIVSCQDPFEYGLVGLKAVRGTGAKLHIQIHTDFLSPWFTRSGIFRSPQVTMPLKNAVRRKIASYVLPRADGIRVVSERIQNSLRKKYGDRIKEATVLPIVPSGLVPQKVPLPMEPYAFTLVTVGRLEPEKRFDDILDALARLRDSYPMVGLVVVGEGRERARLEGKVQEFGLGKRVTFLGARTDAWGLMQSAHAYIQSSAYEGYGLTLIEASLARVPIITSDVGVVGEVLRGFEDVLVTPPGDPTNLAYHIISLIEDPASKEVRVRNAEVRAREHIKKYEGAPERIASDLARLLAV